MTSLLSRWLPRRSPPEPIQPGLYHSPVPSRAERPHRLHLRVEPDGGGVLIVNAATILHLNPTAAAHALLLIRGASEEEAAGSIASRYRVTRRRALRDHRLLRDQILTVATTPEIDPVLFLGLDRQEPYAARPSAPYRLDLALTYRIGVGTALDPLARRRVDRELTTEEWKRILAKAWEVGIPHVTFTGGEPTVHPGLIELIAHAEALGQVTGLLTDGRRLTDPPYLESIRQAGLDHILVALDLGDRATFDGLRGALASDIFTAAHVTITPANSNSVMQVIEELAGLGTGALSLSAASHELASTLAGARHRAALLGMDLIWDLPAPYSATHPINLELETPLSGAGRGYLYVEPDGDILPGQGIDRVLGNFLRDEWEAIWSAAEA